KRYYSAQQLPRLNRILALKDLGLTLKQIAQLLENDVSYEDINGMLMMQKLELEKRLADDLERLRRIESRLGRTQANVPDIVVKSLPALEILSTNHFCLSSQDGLQFVAYLMKKLPPVVGNGKLGHFLALSDEDGYKAAHVDLEFAFFIEDTVPDSITIEDDIALRTRTLPAVEMMATAVHVGHPTTSHSTYGALGHWIESNHYRIVGQQREIFIELPHPDKPNSGAIEIQFPVEKIDSPSFLLTE
ncbi:MAG: MerR family transcriptional regulator, partial [Chloroflexota bacterium]